MRVRAGWGWGELGVGRVAHASTGLCSRFISLFQKCVSNHPGPPPLLWTQRNCETQTVFSARLSRGIHTRISSRALCTHVPAAVAGSSQEIRNAPQAHSRREVPRVPGIWEEPEVLAPRCGLLCSLPWKIPLHSGSALACPARDRLCLGLKMGPQWWSQLWGD